MTSHILGFVIVEIHDIIIFRQTNLFNLILSDKNLQK